jgi:hypothetical protein
MAVEWPGRGIFLEVENATSAFLATCLLLLATALGPLYGAVALLRTYAADFRGLLLLVVLVVQLHAAAFWWHEMGNWPLQGLPLQQLQALRL